MAEFYLPVKVVMFYGAMQDMIKIRPFEEWDWATTWRIIEPVFQAGETYAFSPDITEEEAHKVWVELPSASLRLQTSPRGDALAFG